MELTEKYIRLLEYYDPKKFNLDELAKIIDTVITKVKTKGGDHQAGCAWVIMSLYKKGKCNLVQIDDLIDEFNGYCNGYDDYINSLVMGDKQEAQVTFYNSFLRKKKGE